MQLKDGTELSQTIEEQDKDQQCNEPIKHYIAEMFDIFVKSTEVPDDIKQKVWTTYMAGAWAGVRLVQTLKFKSESDSRFLKGLLALEDELMEWEFNNKEKHYAELN